MKKALIFMLFCLVIAAQAAPMIGRVKIHSHDEIARLSQLGFSIYSDEVKGWVDLALQDEDLLRLQQLGYSVENLTPLPQTANTDIDPEYHTYEELTAELHTLAAQYPTLCKLDSIGRATQFPRAMWSVKLSDNVQTEEDELAALFVGTHHASEVMGMETLLYMINYFLTNYGVNTQITNWMNNYEIFFIPLVNPDGHYAVTSGIDLYWRKNARDIDNDSVYYEFQGGTWWTDDHEGIDPNRNYDWYWNLGGSSDPWAYDYRGTGPLSEGEIQAVTTLGRQQRVVCGFSFHSYGEVVIAPWTFQGQPAPDQDVLNSIATGLANSLIKDNGQHFTWYADEGRQGYCPNWFYGYAGAIFYDVEFNPYPVFIPPGSQLQERCQRYMQGPMYMIGRMAGPGITGHVTNANTGQPLFARVEIQGRISSQVRPRYTEPQYGRFTRLLNNGAYTVFATKAGYHTARIQNVVVNNTLTQLDIQLTPTDQIVDESMAVDLEPGCGFSVLRSSGGTVDFELDLLQAERISLKIYDLLGREVATVFDGYREEGKQSVTFSASQFSSGVYFARLSGESLNVARKFVVVR
ncbi:MAG: M14 family zinc carboxypeptidase [bacterium]|nr:M14 family zinc carboxypeptidase [bacterium]